MNMRVNFLLAGLLTLCASEVIAGVDTYSKLDEIDDWIIERKIESSTNILKCRASIPNRFSWFSGRIHLSNEGDLIIPEETNEVTLTSKKTLDKVMNALNRCRSDFLYIQY